MTTRAVMDKRGTEQLAIASEAPGLAPPTIPVPSRYLDRFAAPGKEVAGSDLAHIGIARDLVCPPARPFREISFGQGLQTPGNPPEQMFPVPDARFFAKHLPILLAQTRQSRGAGSQSLSIPHCSQFWFPLGGRQPQTHERSLPPHRQEKPVKVRTAGDPAINRRIRLLLCARLSDGCVHAAGAARGEQTMKHVTRNPENPALTEVPAEELTPRPDPPAEHHTHRVVMHIGGKRYELTSRVELRQITKGPAKVIEMPERPAI
jgi:hypothetical protein